jgi:hypothetical protein
LIDAQDLDTYGFQNLMGQLTSQGYIEDIRCITFHPFPPITGHSCFNIDAAPVWFGTPLETCGAYHHGKTEVLKQCKFFALGYISINNPTESTE